MHSEVTREHDVTAAVIGQSLGGQQVLAKVRGGAVFQTGIYWYTPFRKRVHLPVFDYR